MIGMAMRVENGVEATDSFAQRLRMKVGASVDDDRVAAVGKPNGGPCAAVTRVARRRHGRGAHRAVATQRWHTHRCAAAEKGEGSFHRLANDAWTARSGTGTLCFCCGRTRQRLGD